MWPFNRLKKKNVTGGDQMTLNQLLDFLGVDRTANGGALSEATYYACLKVLSESIGKLPLRLMRATPTTGISPELKHNYYRMLNVRPNRFMSASVFWTYMEYCRNHYGNAYAYIDARDPAHPQLWPLDPRNVQVIYDNAKMLKDSPDVYYAYSGSSGQVIYGSEEVLHFKAHLTT